MVDINLLRKIYSYCLTYVRYVEEGKWMTGRDDISKFWKDILRKRKNYPEFDDMLNMRVGATDFLETGIKSSSAFESKYSRACYEVWLQSIPKQYFQEIEESEMGRPRQFDFDGKKLSAGAVSNALTAYRIIQWSQLCGIAGRPLRILEIGAGYGQVACQLLQKFDIKSYTICDLPQNLFLSSFYMQSNFPEIAVSFVKHDESVPGEKDGFIFLAPPFLRNLEGPFDLVINSYSFQEMNLSSVQEYFSFIENTLEKEGLFYSLNSYRKAGVVYPSGYAVEKFKLISFAPVRKAPQNYIFSTNPFELIMRRRIEPELNGESLNIFRNQLDALGFILQLGLHEEVLDICRNFSHSRLNLKEAEWLKQLYNFFHVTDYQQKKEHLLYLRRTGILEPVVIFLEANLEFAALHNEGILTILTQASQKLTNLFVKARCFMMLACLYYKSGNREEAGRYYAQAKDLTPHLALEMAGRIKDYKGTASEVAQQLYLSMPAKHMNANILYGKFLRKFLQLLGQEKL